MSFQDKTYRVDADTSGIDAGLRDHMNRVYGLMAGALALTGVIAWAIGSNDALTQAIFGGPWKWVAIIGPFALAMILMIFVEKLSVGAATVLFVVYAAGMGVSLSVIFAAYTQASVAQAFGITSAAFAALSLFGYTTKRDLGPMGAFLLMGLFGLIIASVVNIFLRSSAMDFAVSALGVLIFAGLTAYDTQKIKNDFLDARRSGRETGRLAVIGALNLYLDFVNLMLHILKLIGQRR